MLLPIFQRNVFVKSFINEYTGCAKVLQYCCVCHNQSTWLARETNFTYLLQSEVGYVPVFIQSLLTSVTKNYVHVVIKLSTRNNLFMLTFHHSTYIHAIHHTQLSFSSLILDSAFYVMFPVLKRFRSELRKRNSKRNNISPMRYSV